jgi:tRNA uridine 5-carboxymethylaminomethyl modification enzyme
VTYELLHTLAGAGVAAVDGAVVDQVEVSIKYQGYIDKQRVEIERSLDDEDARLPDGLDYEAVRGLSVEVRQKLRAQRPETLGQAARISGVTPAAISLLRVHLRRWRAAAGEPMRTPA